MNRKKLEELHKDLLTCPPTTMRTMLLRTIEAILSPDEPATANPLHRKFLAMGEEINAMFAKPIPNENKAATYANTFVADLNTIALRLEVQKQSLTDDTTVLAIRFDKLIDSVLALVHTLKMKLEAKLLAAEDKAAGVTIKIPRGYEYRKETVDGVSTERISPIEAEVLEPAPEPTEKTTSVVCGDCIHETHGKELPDGTKLLGTIPQWELPDIGIGVCIVCGQKFGPFPDFRNATSYRLSKELDAEACPDCQSIPCSCSGEPIRQTPLADIFTGRVHVICPKCNCYPCTCDKLDYLVITRTMAASIWLGITQLQSAEPIVKDGHATYISIASLRAMNSREGMRIDADWIKGALAYDNKLKH